MASSFRLKTSPRGWTNISWAQQKGHPAHNLVTLFSKEPLDSSPHLQQKRMCSLKMCIIVCLWRWGREGMFMQWCIHTAQRTALWRLLSSPSFKWVLGLEPRTLGLHGKHLYWTFLPAPKIHSWKQIHKQCGHKVHRIMKSTAPKSDKNRTMASGHYRVTTVLLVTRRFSNLRNGQRLFHQNLRTASLIR